MKKVTEFVKYEVQFFYITCIAMVIHQLLQ